MAFGEMGIFLFHHQVDKVTRRAVLCCAVLVCYRFVGSFRSRLVRWFVGSFVQVGWFVRPFVQVLRSSVRPGSVCSSRFCPLVHSLARLAACRISRVDST